jgi:hypothetical protein
MAGTIYCSSSAAAAVADARQLLDHHQAGNEGRCVICQIDAPCDAANAAVVFLVERKALLYKESQPRLSTVDKRERVLLTFGWRRWFAMRR